MIQGQSKKTKSDSYNTPDYIFDQLNDIYNFTLDAACTRDNCKIPEQKRLMDIERNDNFNSLHLCWAGERVFLNPPFSEKDMWIRESIDKVERKSHGCPIVVLILPLNSMSNKVFHDYIIKRGYEYEILENRISFLDDETKEPVKGNNTGTVIVYIRKRIKV